MGIFVVGAGWPGSTLSKTEAMHSAQSGRCAGSGRGKGDPRAKKSSGKKRGAQAGHKGTSRKLIDSAACDQVINIRAERCLCGHKLVGDDPNPWRHQVTELPPIQPIVTEYQMHRLKCVSCGKSTRGELPVEARGRHFDPRVDALIAKLTGECRVSRRDVQDVLREQFGLKMSLGVRQRAPLHRCASAPL